MYRKTRRLRRNKRRSTKRRTQRQKKMRGGGSDMSRPMGMSATVPSALGNPYNAADLNPNGTYHAYNPNVQQWAEPSNNMAGGRRTKKGKKSKKTKYGKTQYVKTKYGYRKQRGGDFAETISNVFTTLVPQELVNISRSLPAGLGHMYDRYNGAISSGSSMVYPTDQPNVKPHYIDSGPPPPDIAGIYNAKNSLVSRI
jgi:hypothetical protein